MAEEDRKLFTEYSQKFEDSLKRLKIISYNLQNTRADTEGAWGSFLLYRLCVNGGTLVTTWKSQQGIDHYAIAVLARSMIETGIMLMYIMEQGLSGDERKLKRDVLHLHDCISRLRLFKAVDDKGEADTGRSISEELRDRIKTNPLYATFEEDHQKKLLSGEVLYIRGLRAAAINAGASKDWFEVMWITQSAFTHPTPFGFYRSDEREVWKGNSDYAHYVAGFSLSSLWQMMEDVIPRMEIHLESVKAGAAEAAGSGFEKPAS